MRVVITGVTGNVGTSLVRRLAGEPDMEILGISRRAPDAHALDAHEWRCIDVGAGDATERLASAFDGADAVVHLAWQIQPSHDRKVMRRANVDGTQHVLEAAGRAGVPHLVYASSVGAYSPGPKDRPVDESWPTDGIRASTYSRHKAAVERLLDAHEAAHRGQRVARLRPGLIFKKEAASEIARYFLGPLVPASLVPRLRLPRLPVPSSFVFQVVHSDDVAEAYAQVLLQGASGAFNIAADPVLTPDDVADALGARRARSIPVRAVEAAAELTWRARLQPAEGGWVAMAAQAPVMACERANKELGWTPRWDAREALGELLQGFVSGAYGATPPLRSRRGQRWATR